MDAEFFLVMEANTISTYRDSTGPAPVSWRGEGLGSGKGVLHHFFLLFRFILLFGPRRSHSSVPARTKLRPSRAAAVKDGPLFGPPEGLVLDRREHGGKLMWAGV